MRKYIKKPWTMKEKELLAEYYYTVPMKELQIMLPERTVNSIRKQVVYLKSKQRRFKRNVS